MEKPRARRSPISDSSPEGITEQPRYRRMHIHGTTKHETPTHMNSEENSVNLLEPLRLVVQGHDGQSCNAAIWPYPISPTCIGAWVNWRGSKSMDYTSDGVEEGDSKWTQRLHLVWVVAGLNRDMYPVQAQKGQWEHVSVTLPDLCAGRDDFVRIQLNMKTGLAGIRMTCAFERSISLPIPAQATQWSAGQAVLVMGAQLLDCESWQQRRKAWFESEGADSALTQCTIVPPALTPDAATNHEGMFSPSRSGDAGNTAHAVGQHPISQRQYPPLSFITKPCLDTAAAAYYLNRQPQTLRIWACLESGPIRPLRVAGRLAWPVSRIRALLGESCTSDATGPLNSKSAR